MGRHRYVDSGGNQPIILFLRDWIPAYFPQLMNRGGNIHWTGVGGYNPEPGRGAHIEGRAADIYTHTNRADLQMIGDGLFRLFMDHAAELGVENITYNRRTWEAGRDAAGVTRSYLRGDPHLDHIHVSFTPEGAKQQPAILIAYLEQLSRGLSESMGVT